MKQTQDTLLNRSVGWVKRNATWDNAMKAGVIAGGVLSLGGAGAALMSAESVPAALGAVEGTPSYQGPCVLVELLSDRLSDRLS